MANEAPKKEALDRIRDNIAQSGHHIYVVSGRATARFAYTIGISESIGFELILAGAVFYMKDEVVKIINEIAAQLKAQRNREVLEVPGQGLFTLRKAHSSWTTKLILGAFDYYKKGDIPALQVVPDHAHWTIDVPDMTAPWSPRTAPAWRWLHEQWTYPVPEESVGITNLGALRGERITEVMRWEEDEWELFAGAGPDIPKEEKRVVPLGVLLGTDESLVPIVDLPIGKGFWRDARSEWHPWGQSS